MEGGERQFGGPEKEAAVAAAAAASAAAAAATAASFSDFLSFWRQNVDR